MHIPDGFLSFEIWAALYIVSVAVLGFAVGRVNKKIGERQVPLLGVMAAFVFAAQMLNFPVVAGTSGHMLGGVLAAIVLGPFSATIVMAVVFIVQALLFQDGGITALGANVFNMGILGTIGGYYIYKVVRNSVEGDNRGILVGAAVAAWCAVMLGALATSLELGFSGTVPLGMVVPAMGAVHALIGIGEAAITVAVVAYLLKVRPDVVKAAGDKV
jgi:cobalt/nickel transport system permease protein